MSDRLMLVDGAVVSVSSQIKVGGVVTPIGTSDGGVSTLPTFPALPDSGDLRGVTTTFHGCWRTSKNTGCSVARSTLTRQRSVVIDEAWVTAHSGSRVFENKWVRGTVQVATHDITVRNCIIDNSDYSAASSYSLEILGSTSTLGATFSVVVEDVTIVGSSSEPGTPLCLFINASGAPANVRCSRIWMVSSGGDACKANGENITIEDCRIDALLVNPGGHCDGIQTTGASDLVIRRNYITGFDLTLNPDLADVADYGQGACLFLSTEAYVSGSSPREYIGIDGLYVVDNYLDGGGYSLNGDYGHTGAPGPGSNYNFTGNRFGPHHKFTNPGNAYFKTGPATVAWSGNVMHLTGEDAIA